MPNKAIHHDQERRHGTVGTVDDYVVDDRCGFCGEFEPECICDEFEPECICD